jgi:hypothetical protein
MRKTLRFYFKNCRLNAPNVTDGFRKNLVTIYGRKKPFIVHTAGGKGKRGAKGSSERNENILKGDKIKYLTSQGETKASNSWARRGPKQLIARQQ